MKLTTHRCTMHFHLQYIHFLKRCVVQHFRCHILRHACKTNDLLFKRNVEIERFKSDNGKLLPIFYRRDSIKFLTSNIFIASICKVYSYLQRVYEISLYSWTNFRKTIILLDLGWRRESGRFQFGFCLRM